MRFVKKTRFRNPNTEMAKGYDVCSRLLSRTLLALRKFIYCTLLRKGAVDELQGNNGNLPQRSSFLLSNNETQHFWLFTKFFLLGSYIRNGVATGSSSLSRRSTISNPFFALTPWSSQLWCSTSQNNPLCTKCIKRSALPAVFCGVQCCCSPAFRFLTL